ncbi:hypothetical protein [Demequina subtropica]|uniref:hypothetical protein n=1 Tax=Demequina subtropica TaxID=1638989 RepID=UPI000780C7EB|nr:hypothetical protein [Demequina subtropica]
MTGLTPADIRDLLANLPDNPIRLTYLTAGGPLATNLGSAILLNHGTPNATLYLVAGDDTTYITPDQADHLW